MDDQRLRHTEEFTWELTPDDGNTWDRSASLKHSTALLFGNRGSLEAYGAFGFDNTGLDGGSSSLTFFAMEAGIIGEFSF